MGDTWIYHEKQDSALCGQHCINNLLQDGRFTAPELAELALQLDAQERAMMLLEGHDTPDALKFLAEESGNIDNSGNFSIQVLSQALERAYGLRLVSAGSEEVRERLRTTGFDREEGFVCNRHDHWLAIRSISGRYWNLNSTLDYPEHITTFALEATLAQYRADGYSVFVVRGGKMPAPRRVPGSGASDSWYRETELLAHKNKQPQPGGSKFRTLGSGGALGAGPAAKPASAADDVWRTPGHRLDGGGGSSSGKRGRFGEDDAAGAGNGGFAAAGLGHDEDEDLVTAIAMSLSESQAAEGGAAAAAAAAAPAASAAPVPDEPPQGAPGAVRIQIKLPTGGRTVRRFLSGDAATVLFDFVTQELRGATAPAPPRFELVGPKGRLAREALDSEGATIESAGLAGASVTVRMLAV